MRCEQTVPHCGTPSGGDETGKQGANEGTGFGGNTPKLAQIAAAAVAANVAAEAEESVEAPAADTTEETAKVDVAVESTVESAAESAGNAGDTERVEQVEGEVIDDAEQSADDAAAVTVEDAAEES